MGKVFRHQISYEFPCCKRIIPLIDQRETDLFNRVQGLCQIKSIFCFCQKIKHNIVSIIIGQLYIYKIILKHWLRRSITFMIIYTIYYHIIYTI